MISMKDDYDFSQGERGNFFTPDAKFNLPVYLEGEVMTFIEEIAAKKKVDASIIVNQILRKDMQLAEVIK